MQYSVIPYNQVEAFRRLDAEFFDPRILSQLHSIEAHHGKTLAEFGAKVVSGPFGSSLKSEEYISDGVPFIRISDLSDFFISDENLIYISEENNRQLKSSQLKIGDLVLSKVGNTIGVVSQVTDDIGNCNISENNIGIRFDESLSKEQRHYALTFLNSKPGQTQIIRAISGNAQPKLNVSDIEGIKIAELCDDLVLLISKCVESSFSENRGAIESYKSAENLLLSALNLADWTPHHQLSFVRPFKDVDASLRMDGEHFQPMYDEIIGAVKAVFHDALGELVTYEKGVEVGTAAYTVEGVPFIRVSDISEKGIERTDKNITEALYRELATKHSPRKGDILMTKDGTIGRAFVVHEDVKAILSGAFLKLKLKKDVALDREYLALVINSLVCKQQIEKMAGGAIIAHLKPSDAMKLVIPLLDEAIQAEISAKIIASRTKREQSKALLDIAKRGVEIAIEQNESTAQTWLEEQLQALGV